MDATTPRHGLLLLLVVAVLSLAAFGGCGDDDDDVDPTPTVEDEQSSRDAYLEAGCTLAAKGVELIASGLREGHGFKQLVEDYGSGVDKGCEFVLKAWANRPDTQLDITVTGLSGSTLDGELSGLTLKDLAPEDEAGQRSCENWDDELLRSLCEQGP